MRNLPAKQLALSIAPFAIGLLIMSACTVSESNKNDASTTAAQNRQLTSAMPAVDVTTSIAEEDTTTAMDTVASTTADTTAGTAAGTATVIDTAAALASITPQNTTTLPASFPQTPPKAGPTTLQLQILLDRSNFSPGVLTGVWDNNARHALTWYRVARGMDSSATMDRATYDQLRSSAGSTPLVTQYTLTDADVKGPFVDIPPNVYQKAKLNCLCYQSVSEEMNERFHSSPALMRRLNPNVNLKTLKAGSTLWVPNVARDTAAPAAYTTARIMISKTDFWTHAIDSSGRIVAHYPSTLGNSYDPSPTGDFSVASITRMPAFHYQPTLFHEVPDSKPEAHLAGGPNSPVGVIWMALSKEHYGIHGTENPATIGVTQSHGCVRLTNWDAWTLGGTVHPGVPVTFQ